MKERKNMKFMKQVISLCLVLALVCGFLPVGARAEETVAEETVAAETVAAETAAEDPLPDSQEQVVQGYSEELIRLINPNYAHLVTEEDIAPSPSPRAQTYANPVFVTSVDKADDVEFCALNGCESASAKNNYIVSHSNSLRKNTEENLDIHIKHDNKWTENYTRELDLSINQKGETFTCKIILGVDPEKAAGINGVGSKKPISFLNNTLYTNFGVPATITLYSVTGVEEFSKNIGVAGTLALSNIRKGMYIYRAKANGKTYTGKIIIK
jgi:hypothetical protein